jgi:hypothetical protein
MTNEFEGHKKNEKRENLGQLASHYRKFLEDGIM